MVVNVAVHTEDMRPASAMCWTSCCHVMLLLSKVSILALPPFGLRYCVCESQRNSQAGTMRAARTHTLDVLLSRDAASVKGEIFGPLSNCYYVQWTRVQQSWRA